MNFSKELIVPENQDIMENLRVGQIFSAYNFPVSYSYDVGGEIRTSQPEYMVYLGPDSRPNAPWNHLRFVVVLKNGDTIILSENRGNIERNLDRGWMTKSNRKLIKPQLLEEIRNYLPERQTKEKENVEIVGNETPINLPPEIKNNILSLLGRYPEGENQFPEDYKNEKDDNQKAGRRRKSNSTFRKSTSTSTFRKSGTKTTFKKSTFKKSRTKSSFKKSTFKKSRTKSIFRKGRNKKKRV